MTALGMTEERGDDASVSVYAGPVGEKEEQQSLNCPSASETDDKSTQSGITFIISLIRPPAT